MDNSTAPLTSIGHRWHRPAFAFLFMSNPASAPRGRHTARTAGTRDHYTVWLWDTPATCICDTLTWFPTKTTMPLASSNDQIIAGIKDIVHALNNPSPGLPPAPLTESHHNALTDLSNIFTSIVNPETKPSPAASGSLLQRHDPPLRVTESPSDVTCLPVGHLTHPSTLPLRVFPPPAAADPKTVSFAPLPTLATGTTFSNRTNAQSKQRRRVRRQNNASSTAHPAKAVHPNKLLIPIPNRIVAPHHYGTRSSTKQLQHVATCARAVLLDDARAP
jgi:hypothetical protein